MHYSILETTGWLGIGWGIEWCVVGLDRNWAYNPACRMGPALISTEGNPARTRFVPKMFLKCSWKVYSTVRFNGE